MFDPSLLLSPHVFLLAIIFRHRAWASESLNNDVSELSRLAPVQGVEELGLPLKEELSKQYIFRQWAKTSTGWSTLLTVFVGNLCPGSIIPCVLSIRVMY